MEKFQPRKGFRQVWIFLAVFSIFPIGAIAASVFGALGPAAALGAASVFFYALMLPQAAAWGYRYVLSDSGLVLRSRGTERELPFPEIKSMDLLNAETAGALLTALQEPAVQAERGMDFFGWIRANKYLGEVTRYQSVPLVQSVQTAGSSVNIVKHKSRMTEEIILLRTKNGEILTLSPADPQALYNRLKSCGVKSQPYSSAEIPGYLQDFRPARNNRRFFFRYGVITSSLLIIGILVYLAFGPPALIYPLYDNYFGESEKPQEEVPKGQQNLSMQQEVLHAGWADENTFVFALPKEEQEEMVQKGGLTAGIYMEGAQVLIALLRQEGELELPEEDLEGAVDYLGQFLTLHSRLDLAEESDIDGKVHLIFTVYLEGLHSAAPGLIKGNLN